MQQHNKSSRINWASKSRKHRGTVSGQLRSRIHRAVASIESLESRRLFATFQVTTSSDFGAGSFRDAIGSANANPGADIINFNNAGGATYSITPSTALPTIFEAVTINASTGVTSGLTDSIIGTSAGAGVAGLVIASSNVTIKGLCIRNFGGDGVRILGDSNTIDNCQIGLNLAGTAAAGNGGNGIYIGPSADNNKIGGIDSNRSVFIGGNTGAGIYIDGTGVGNTQSNTITNCRIGTNSAGNAKIANGTDGIAIYNGSKGNIIGPGNVISGNTGAGIATYGAVTDSQTIASNLIGVNAANTAVLGNSKEGVLLSSDSWSNTVSSNVIAGNTLSNLSVAGHLNTVQFNYIGTNGAGAAYGGGKEGVYLSSTALSNTIKGNWISGNALQGVFLDGADSNTISGNYIGVVGGPGATALGNGSDGISILNGAQDNLIGGPNAADKNVISANTFAGVAVAGASSTGNTIRGNHLGTNGDGNADLGNKGEGVFLREGASATVVAGNLLSGNDSGGIDINNSNSNVISGNIIGLAADGTTPLANTFQGIAIFNGASGNLIGGDTSIDRNIISANTTHGVDIYDATTTNNTLINNFIGVASDGVTRRGNGGNGVTLNFNAHGNFIGKPGKPANVISGNAFAGVNLRATAANTIANNLIGLAADGNTFRGNGGVGIAIREGATGNLVGGTSSAARNVISGNTSYGVNIFETGTSGNSVFGNFIGTDITGTLDRGNGALGVLVNAAATNNIIGSVNAGWGNVISGNNTGGVSIEDAGSTGNFVRGNFIGTNAAGTASLQNEGFGVRMTSSATNSVIEGNLISGNNGDGVLLIGPNIPGFNLSVTVKSNLIGTNSSGSAAIANHGAGIIVQDGSGVIIGGTNLSDGNTISGNNSHGVVTYGGNAALIVVQNNRVGINFAETATVGNGGNGINFENSSLVNSAIGNIICGNGGNAPQQGGILAGGQGSHTIRGNFIGTNRTGAASLGNLGFGVRTGSTSGGNKIGGVGAGDGNVIVNNSAGGVEVFTTPLPGTGNSIMGNAIDGNGGLGIDLNIDGVTANDALDTDTGPNNLQNFPVISGYTTGSSGSTINGTFNSTPNSTFRFEFFDNFTTAPDPSGHGEASNFIAAIDVTTDASGNAGFSAVSPFQIPSGSFVTGTATAFTGSGASVNYLSTSEFALNSASNVPLTVTNSGFTSELLPQTISISFNEYAGDNLLPSTLQVTNLTTGQTIVADSVSYIATTNTANWKYGTILPDGNYTATLSVGSVKGRAGNTLSSPFSTSFYFLEGDANHDRKVNTLDFNILAANFGPPDGNTFSQGNFSLDVAGVVDSLDFAYLVSRYGKSLPAPSSTVAFSVSAMTSLPNPTRFFKGLCGSILDSTVLDVDDQWSLASL